MEFWPFRLGAVGANPSNSISPARDEGALMAILIDPTIQIEKSNGSDPTLASIFYFSFLMSSC